MKAPLVVINGRFLTQVVTGVQRYAVEMVLGLLKVRRQYEIVVVAPSGRLISQVPNLVQDNFPITGHLWEQVRLPWLMKKMKADLLWCPGFTAPLLNLGVPLVVTFHDAATFAGPEWFSPTFTLYYRCMMPLVGRVATKIITDSEFSRQELIKYSLVGRPDNIEVVYCGLTSLGEMKNKADKSIEQLQGKRYVLSLGSVNPRKNISRLVMAWHRIPNEVKKGRILAIAGRAYRVFSEEKFSVLPEDVIFLDYVPDDKLFELYSKADAFVYPALYEGFGIPPIEAMSCGTPVIVSKVSSLPEVCGNAALYCDPYNVDDIADKLCQLLTDKSLVMLLRQRGFERIKIFSWTKSAQKLIDIFKIIISEARF
jgi:glycosyltransferase involved in cell wall biosynthesis